MTKPSNDATVDFGNLPADFGHAAPEEPAPASSGDTLTDGPGSGDTHWNADDDPRASIGDTLSDVMPEPGTPHKTVPGSGNAPIGISPFATGADVGDLLGIAVRPRRFREQGGYQEAEQADYEIVRELGTGAAGVVCEARQTSVDRHVAVKRLRKPAKGEQSSARSLAGVRRKFLAEAIVAADLDHPNIVPIYDLGVDDDGAVFYSMKHVDGTPWCDVITEKSLTENLAILKQVADAIAFAHSRGIVHRDLKPENVMLGEFGEVLVMDWGLALTTEAFTKAGGTTRRRGRAGTPAYMAPEMSDEDISGVGTHSDIYLLGAILYEILSGHPPHPGATVAESLAAARDNVIVPVETPSELLDIALQAMSLFPARRHADVAEFKAALVAYEPHAESVRIAARATAHLERARDSRDHADFARAVFEYEEAVDVWSENDAARHGVSAARLAYARNAIERDDLDLAEGLLLADDPAHEETRAVVVAAQRERTARQRRLVNRQRISVIAVALLFVTVAGAAVWINQERTNALAAKTDWEEKCKVAWVDRDDARDLVQEEQQARLVAERRARSFEERIAAVAAVENERDEAVASIDGLQEERNTAVATATDLRQSLDKAVDARTLAERERDAAELRRENAIETERSAAAAAVVAEQEANELRASLQSVSVERDETRERLAAETKRANAVTATVEDFQTKTTAAETARKAAQAERDAAVDARVKAVAERNETLTAIKQAIETRDKAVQSRTEAEAELKEALAAAKQAREQQVAAVKSRDAAVAEAKRAVETRDEALAARTVAVAATEKETAAVTKARATIGELEKSLAEARKSATGDSTKLVQAARDAEKQAVEALAAAKQAEKAAITRATAEAEAKTAALERAATLEKSIADLQRDRIAATTARTKAEAALKAAEQSEKTAVAKAVAEAKTRAEAVTRAVALEKSITDLESERNAARLARTKAEAERVAATRELATAQSATKELEATLRTERVLRQQAEARIKELAAARDAAPPTGTPVTGTDPVEGDGGTNRPPAAGDPVVPDPATPVVAPPAVAPAGKDASDRYFYDARWTKFAERKYHLMKMNYRANPGDEKYTYHYAIAYDADREHVYFYDPATKRIWGRYSIGAERDRSFSLVVSEENHTDGTKIEAGEFGEPGPLPKVPGAINATANMIPPHYFPNR